MAYRISRNLEASIIDFLENNLDSDWGNVDVVKTFAEVYGVNMSQSDRNAIVCVRCGITPHDWVELGSKATKREPAIIIDLFCANDGQRLDLKDYLIEKLKNGCAYYKYTIVNGAVDSKVADGRISLVAPPEDEPIDFNTPKNELEPIDRYRHRITLRVSTGDYES